MDHLEWADVNIIHTSSYVLTSCLGISCMCERNVPHLPSSRASKNFYLTLCKWSFHLDVPPLEHRELPLVL
jgi:hypothetical protein